MNNPIVPVIRKTDTDNYLKIDFHDSNMTLLHTDKVKQHMILAVKGILKFGGAAE